MWETLKIYVPQEIAIIRVYVFSIERLQFEVFLSVFTKHFTCLKLPAAGILLK